MSDHQQWQHRTDGPNDGPSEHPGTGSPTDRVVPGTVLGGSRYERTGHEHTGYETVGHGNTGYGSAAHPAMRHPAPSPAPAVPAR